MNVRKKILAVLLAALMTLSAFPVYAETAETDPEGKVIDLLSWLYSKMTNNTAGQDQPVVTDATGSENTAAPLTEYWTPDSAAAEHLRSYVAKVTNAGDPENYIPERD